MEHLFFNLDGDFDEAFRKFFTAIGVPDFQEGDSANVLGGIYGSASIFGLTIKIEGNSYNYEDEYKWMVSIRKDVLSPLAVDASLVNALTSIVARLLADNQGIAVARETRGGVVVVHQQK